MPVVHALKMEMAVTRAAHRIGLIPITVVFVVTANALIQIVPVIAAFQCLAIARHLATQAADNLQWWEKRAFAFD